MGAAPSSARPRAARRSGSGAGCGGARSALLGFTPPFCTSAKVGRGEEGLLHVCSVCSRLNWWSPLEASTPFLLRRFFFPRALFLLAFFTLSFFILFSTPFSPSGRGGAAFPAPLPCPAPRSMPSCLRGLGSDPSALGLLRRATELSGLEETFEIITTDCSPRAPSPMTGDKPVL